LVLTARRPTATEDEMGNGNGISFKPSDVVLHAPPLAGTMGKAEREHAAALMVRACQQYGDEWGAVPWSAVKSVILADVESKREPVSSLMSNPFFRPDVKSLADAGYCTITGELGKIESATFTVKGIRALMMWVPLAPEMVPS
jgi:hypothetical protein